MFDVNVNDWGRYAPLQGSLFLRGLIRVGLGRGVFRKKILLSWRRKYGSLVDVTVRGIHYRLNLSDNVTDRKIFGSSIIYDKVELAYLIAAARKGVFVDIGANSGYYTLTLAKEAECRVIAFEPNPITLERLTYNVAINAPLKGQIEIIPMGVGDEGEFDLHYGDSLGSASLNESLIVGTRNVIRIKTQPLLDLLREQGIERVDALKIDIEGAEDTALVPFFRMAHKDLWPKCIVMEEAHHHVWATDLNGILRQSGYKLTAQSGGNAIWHLLT